MLVFGPADRDGITLELLNTALCLRRRAERFCVHGSAWVRNRPVSSLARPARRDVDIGLSDCRRSAVLTENWSCRPKRESAIDAIVAQDIREKTPFKPEDIYSDHVDDTSIPMGGGKLWFTNGLHGANSCTMLSCRSYSVEDLTFIVFLANNVGGGALSACCGLHRRRTLGVGRLFRNVLHVVLLDAASAG